MVSSEVGPTRALESESLAACMRWGLLLIAIATLLIPLLIYLTIFPSSILLFAAGIGGGMMPLEVAAGLERRESRRLHRELRIDNLELLSRSRALQRAVEELQARNSSLRDEVARGRTEAEIAVREAFGTRRTRVGNELNSLFGGIWIGLTALASPQAVRLLFPVLGDCKSSAEWKAAGDEPAQVEYKVLQPFQGMFAPLGDFSLFPLDKDALRSFRKLARPWTWGAAGEIASDWETEMYHLEFRLSEKLPLELRPELEHGSHLAKMAQLACSQFGEEDPRSACFNAAWGLEEASDHITPTCIVANWIQERFRPWVLRVLGNDPNESHDPRDLLQELQSLLPVVLSELAEPSTLGRTTFQVGEFVSQARDIRGSVEDETWLLPSRSTGSVGERR